MSSTKLGEGKKARVHKKGGKMYPLTCILLHVGSAQKKRTDQKKI